MVTDSVPGSAANGRHIVNCPECNAEVVYWTTDPWVPEVIHEAGHGTHTLQWGTHREPVLS